MASDPGSPTIPNLIMNCNPSSPFRIPRWLIARFIALQFKVTQFRNEKKLHVLRFFDGIDTHLYLSHGSCAEHSNLEHDVFWVKADVSHVNSIVSFTFTHNCSEDHLDSESWATRSKDFGNADREVRVSLTPYTWISGSVFVIHLELLGLVFQERLQESGSQWMFPSLATLKRNTLRTAPSDHAPAPPLQPRTPLQIEQTSSAQNHPLPSSRTHAFTSTTTSHVLSS